MELLDLILSLEYYLCLLLVVLLYRLRRPFASRIGRSLSTFPILEVVSYILTVSLIIGSPLAYVEAKFLGDVVDILKEIINRGPSTTF